MSKSVASGESDSDSEGSILVASSSKSSKTKAGTAPLHVCTASYVTYHQFPEVCIHLIFDYVSYDPSTIFSVGLVNKTQLSLTNSGALFFARHISIKPAQEE
ncbi:hypothetical protein TrLO_g2611 [Triparma laevis f. longispina]|uniref:Uncharacterized protein n=1 Tax=Triparma laevis f. longispina TaxID=1714387 RepID=A0A9W7FN44_9STRA|nr:hypothetical protein TrLO_g2611 [Triparma laevis f. longispina]